MKSGPAYLGLLRPPAPALLLLALLLLVLLHVLLLPHLDLQRLQLRQRSIELRPTGLEKVQKNNYVFNNVHP